MLLFPGNCGHGNALHCYDILTLPVFLRSYLSLLNAKRRKFDSSLCWILFLVSFSKRRNKRRNGNDSQKLCWKLCIMARILTALSLCTDPFVSWCFILSNSSLFTNPFLHNYAVLLQMYSAGLIRLYNDDAFLQIFSLLTESVCILKLSSCRFVLFANNQCTWLR